MQATLATAGKRNLTLSFLAQSAKGKEDVGRIPLVGDQREGKWLLAHTELAGTLSVHRAASMEQTLPHTELWACPQLAA